MINKNDYKKFLEKNFPETGVLNNDNIYNIYARICENNLSIDIFIENILSKLGENESCIRSLMKRYRDQVNRLLIIIPINDIYSLNFYMRVIVENLLKVVYALNFDKKLKEISNLKFRDVKDALMSLKEIHPRYKQSIECICSLYAQYSNLLHNKDNRGSEIEVMERIIKSNEIDLKKIDKDLIAILKSYQIIISHHFEIQEKSMTTAQKIRIVKNLSNSRGNQFKSNLFKKSERI